MKTKHRLFLVGGILAGAVALGCQAPTATVRQPRLLKSIGELKIDPDASLAVVVQPECPTAQKRYGVRALPANIADSRIDHLIIKITGDNLLTDIEVPVSRSEIEQAADCSNLVSSVVALSMIDLPPGNYKIVFNSYDSAGKVVSYDEQIFQVDPNPTVTKTITVTCKFDLGKIQVKVDCCKSPAPNPSPTPTPTPTPMPLPTPLVIPSGVLGGAIGFTVASDGSTDIFGWDPVPSALPYTRGNIVKVNPDLSLQQPVPVFNDMEQMSEGDYVGSMFFGASSTLGGTPPLARTKVSFDTSASIPTPVLTAIPAPLVPFTPDTTGSGYINFPHYHANTVNDAGDFIWSGTASLFSDRNTLARAFFVIQNTIPNPSTNSRQIFVDYRTKATPQRYFAPHSMAWARDLQLPVWASEEGFCKPSRPNPLATPDPSATPEVIVATSMRGLVLPTNSSDECFFTRYGYTSERQIFYYNKTTHPSPIPVTTFDWGFPRNIEKDAAGNIYVMLAESNISMHTGGLVNADGSFLESQRFRIVRLAWDASDPVNPKLVPVQLMVEHFNDRRPSWPTMQTTP